jgi:hypothetical protein
MASALIEFSVMAKDEDRPLLPKASLTGDLEYQQKQEHGHRCSASSKGTECISSSSQLAFGLVYALQLEAFRGLVFKFLGARPIQDTGRMAPAQSAKDGTKPRSSRNVARPPTERE